MNCVPKPEGEGGEQPLGGTGAKSLRLIRAPAKDHSKAAQ
ncbi:hypothetical protein OP10G_3249 [Fimbriimonas ginsengisoli Gsoil 348]|uniref:Uncharacterized protein n=1 Tax=Fimbriimonas ginsengisoli Gsoil 348 TaxID=661478 RepID=A0A068NTG0_FIMGI|nr:hypothetical protein OP10G_3249 [Fimbriimonas ginsengisoli Gsoil 348]